MARPEDIRGATRAARRSLGVDERLAADRAIATALIELLATRPAGSLACYLPTDGEVDLTSAVEPLRALGWRLLLPIVGDATTMHFASWTDGDDLVPNRYGISEPRSVSQSVSVSELDVVVLPCVAVDLEGHRLGFGAGYYDRALADEHDVLRVGVAYEVQVVDRIDAQPWDVPLDVVLTERRRVDREAGAGGFGT